MKTVPYIILLFFSVGLLISRHLKPQKAVTPSPIGATSTGIMPVPAKIPVPTSSPITSQLPIVPVPRKVPWPRVTNARNNLKKKRRRIR